MRSLLAAVALALLFAAPADARLRPVAKLKAKADAAGVHLSWRDHSARDGQDARPRRR
jgi:hypothetical protein